MVEPREFDSRARASGERRELILQAANKEHHLEELYEKLASARSDDFRARVSGWIDQEQDSISDIKSKLEDIEGWIDEEKEKLE